MFDAKATLTSCVSVTIFRVNSKLLSPSRVLKESINENKKLDIVKIMNMGISSNIEQSYTARKYKVNTETEAKNKAEVKHFLNII